MLDILIELGVEELPVSEGEKIIDMFGDSVRDFFREYELQFKNILATGGPRRIVLVIEELQDRQEDKMLKIYGPPRNVFFSQDGAVSKAGENFLQKNNIGINELLFESKDDAKSKDIEYAVYTKKIEGYSSIILLKSSIKKILDSLSIKKRMRWADRETQFSRPIRWICALCNGKIFDLEVGSIKSSNITYGHRFLSPQSVEINGIEDYFEKLEKKFVYADKNKRKRVMLEKMRKLINEENEDIFLDDELIDTNNFLVEFPEPLRADFPEEFLLLPKETLTSTMIKHQKYFPIYNKKSGELKNSFISISNMTQTYVENIREGNLRVINARFEDAKFYYNSDLEKDISFFTDKLKAVTYIEGLGSVFDKTQRLMKTAEFLCGKIGCNEKQKMDVLKAAEICKFDLASGMVYEFPQLQGIIGEYYARKKNLPENISSTIREHYLPAGNHNELPQTATAKIVALADKTDIICSCFILSLKPTGSADPYALRRAARGIISIIQDYNISIDLADLFAYAMNLCAENLTLKNKTDSSAILAEIISFTALRLENLFLEQNFDQQFITMSINRISENFDIIRIKRKLEAITKLRNDENLEKVIKAFKRTNNILKKIDEFVSVKASLFSEDIEKSLYSDFNSIRDNVEISLKSNDYENIIRQLAGLGKIIDEYFEKVMVMDKNSDIKNNRLSMLKEITDYYKKIYNF